MTTWQVLIVRVGVVMLTMVWEVAGDLDRPDRISTLRAGDLGARVGGELHTVRCRVGWARGHPQDEHHLLMLVVWLKSYQRLGHFPKITEVPVAVAGHVRGALGLADEVELRQAASMTASRHRAFVRQRMGVSYEAARVRRVAEEAVRKAVQSKDNPADLINVALRRSGPGAWYRRRWSAPVAWRRWRACMRRSRRRLGWRPPRPSAACWRRWTSCARCVAPRPCSSLKSSWWRGQCLRAIRSRRHRRSTWMPSPRDSRARSFGTRTGRECWCGVIWRCADREVRHLLHRLRHHRRRQTTSPPKAGPSTWTTWPPSRPTSPTPCAGSVTGPLI
ncbi:DUF4158 domain-containing protein [Microbispora sp. NEAU-D428]|nr:DUF4158 domain-containing protein [Microbispora sitophila]